MNKKIFCISLRLIVGLIFIFSAIVKLFPAEILEIAIVETGLMSWALAPFVARLLIAFELFLGIVLITGLYPRLIIKVSLATLLIFTVYLLIILLTQGNQDNCNCFGMLFFMTPFESVLKNIILIILLLISLRLSSINKWRFSLITLISIGIISIVASFVSAPIILRSDFPVPGQINYALNFDLIYNNPDTEEPEVNLKEGKWILVFLSTSCKQCVVAGYRLSVINNSIKNLPLYFFINGDDEGIKEFHFQTKTRDIPYSNIKAQPMVYYTGGRLPTFFWIEDGVLVNQTGTYNFTGNDIINWLKN